MTPRLHGSSARRPSIGITPDWEGGSAGGAPPRYELKVAYADAVVRAGGLPLVLPYSDDATVVEAYLDRISGLVVTGGNFDIPAQAYGAQPSEALLPPKEKRTAFETAILQGALKRNLPVLGVCGGMQLLNVVQGGTLYQDIVQEVEKAKDHQQKHDRSQPHHPVDVKDGTLLSELLGKGQLMVNSTHHQAVKRLGEHLRPCALAADGVVEAVESTTHAFALGVQWHPELMLHTVPLHLGVYRGLVTKARESRRSG